MTAEAIEIRNCSANAELEACVALQKTVWNFSDLDLVPLRMFVVALKIGGQVIGAFDGDRLIGFALSTSAGAAGDAPDKIDLGLPFPSWRRLSCALMASQLRTTSREVSALTSANT